MTDKSTRLREIAREMDALETEWAELLGETDKPKRGRPRNKNNPEDQQIELLKEKDGAAS